MNDRSSGPRTQRGKSDQQIEADPAHSESADAIWTIQQSATFLGISEDKARRRIGSASITPIRTSRGVGYQSSDIQALKETR